MGPAPARGTASGLPIGAELQPRREFEREAVGHPGDEVDDLVYAVFELNCPTANGDALFVREHGRWRQLDIDPFECREAPRGVIRSLLGSCLTG